MKNDDIYNICAFFNIVCAISQHEMRWIPIITLEKERKFY